LNNTPLVIKAPNIKYYIVNKGWTLSFNSCKYDIEQAEVIAEANGSK
jgi:hypothetical protein